MELKPSPRICTQCSAPFDVTGGALQFYADISPVVGGEKVDIPPPTLCPRCRAQRRLAYRNQLYVFSRPSSLTGKQLFSMYPDTSSFPVVEKDFWWSDEWDALNYGRDFNFKEPFFIQLERLRDQVPHFPLSMVNTENSDYCNNCGGVKNGYFVFNSNYSEDCLYCEDIHYSRDCIDCSTCIKCELCYDCVDCRNCFDVQSSQSSENCASSLYLLNCRGCTDCFGCANLRQAQYCVFNEQLTREAYQGFMSGLRPASFAQRRKLRRKCESFFKTKPRPHAQFRSVEDVSGDYITECRSVHDSFFVHDLERAHYCFNVKVNSHDLWDVSTFGTDMSYVYESAVVGHHANNLTFCYDCWNGVSDLSYCWMCSSSANLFGCVGLRRKEYCILNRQYSREAYDQLLSQIIEHMRRTGEWGQFFPMSLSPVPYNYSLAQRIFPLSQGEAVSLGLRWYDRPLMVSGGALEAERLPDGHPQADESLTVKSALSGKAFKITAHEIRRYRTFNVPLPRLAYDERAEARWHRLGGLELTAGRCEKTGRELGTTVNAAEGWHIWDREEYEKHFSS